MPDYVDGYVIPILKKNLAAYRRMARLGAKLWKQHGALAFYECAGMTCRCSSAPRFRAG